MKVPFNQTLAIPLLINVSAALLIIAFQRHIAILGPTGIIALAVALILGAACVAVGPAAVVAFARQLKLSPKLRRSLSTLAVVTGVQIFTLLCSFGLLLFTSMQLPAPQNFSTYVNTLGPVLALVALGCFAVFFGGAFVTMRAWPSFASLLVLLAVFVISALLVQHPEETHPIAKWRLGSSVILGSAALSYVQGFLHGFFDSAMKPQVLGDHTT